MIKRLMQIRHGFFLMAVAVLGALVFQEKLDAHTDPVGDVHPEVVVENGRFAVYFRNNEGPHLANRPEPSYRIVYEKDGAITAPRHRVSPEKSRRRNPAWVRGLTRTSPDGLKFIFPGNWQSYQIEQPNGSKVRRRLPWPNGGLGEGERDLPHRAKPGDAFDVFEDFAVSETHLALLGTDASRSDLQVVLFERDSLEAPMIVKLGGYRRIYHFPSCSNLVYAKGKFRVAWMEPDEYATRLMFASIDSSGKMTKRELELLGDWNSHLSLAAIEDRVCLVYHYGRGTGRGDSRIITWFDQLED